MSVEPPAKGTFQVGDLVRNTSAAYHEKERIVRQINPVEDDEPMLIVRQDEDDPKSILWSWRSFMCRLVKAAPVFNVHDRVFLGTGNVEREVKDTRIHNKTGEMQYRVDVDGEKEKWVIAAALHRVETPAPVAEFTPGSVIDICEVSIPRLNEHWGSPLNLITVKLYWVCPNCGAKRNEIGNGFSYDGSRRLNVNTWKPCDCGHIDTYELCRAEARKNGLNDDLFAPVADNLKATESAGGTKISDLWDFSAPAGGDTDALFQASLKLAEAQQLQKDAEERAEAAEKLVAELEQIIRNHEAYAKQPQPVPSAQRECVEYKTLAQKILGYPEDLKVADREVAECENQQWQTVNIAYVGGGENPDMRYVMFKRTITAPAQPTIGTIGAHASLTGDFVRESRSPFRTPERDSVEVPAVGTLVVESKKEIKLGPIGTAMKEMGREETGQIMTDFALQKAFAAGAERIANMPTFNRPLHTLKASN